MEKVWLNEYPKDIPHEINPDAYTSIIDLFKKSCQNYTKHPMYKNMGTVLSYDDVDQLSEHFASYLQSQLQLKKGDRFAIMLPNVLQYPVALFGALKAGCVVVNVNPLYTARELVHQLKDAECETIIILENFAHTLDHCLANTPIKNIITTEIGDLFPFFKKQLVNKSVKYIKKLVPPFKFAQSTTLEKALKLGQNKEFQVVPLINTDLAFLQYTGGTTGVSKGAMLSHRNLIANLLQAESWVNLSKGKEIVVSALPLYHIFALMANCLLFMFVGGCNLLITNPRDIPDFIKTLKNEKFTAFSGVNTLFNALVNHPDFNNINFSELHLTLGGGMAVQESVASKWITTTGCVLLEAYGLTEASPAVCINLPTLKKYNGSIGLPIPSTDISIIDSNGNHLAIGEVGELCVKGPQVMLGYYNLSEDTKAIFTEDGWLKTGDIATVDEKGYVRLSSRKKDMIVVSGFNVYPNEIEEVISQLDGVLECAAVGVPDKRSGERIKVYIVKKDPSLNEERVMNFCIQNLTNYKRPKTIVFRDSLPKSNVGKILHRVLREESAKEFENKIKQDSLNRMT